MKKKFLLVIPPLLAIFLLLILPKEKPPVKNQKARYVSPFNYDSIKIRKLIRADILRLEDDNVVRLDGISYVGIDEASRSSQLNITRADREYLRREAEDVMANILTITYNAYVEPSGRRDQEKREYCYVFVRTFGDATSFRPEKDIFIKTKDGYQIFLNAYLVRMGYALCDIYNQDKYTGLLSKMESRAKSEGLGLWGRTK